MLCMCTGFIWGIWINARLEFTTKNKEWEVDVDHDQENQRYKYKYAFLLTLWAMDLLFYS